jgi:hypothetical protein
MTNFEKCKEEIKLEDFMNDSNGGFCKAIHKVRGEEHCGSRGCTECKNWLKQEYQEPILDKAEKKYLSNIVRPFRDKVEYIEKYKSPTCQNEYIGIWIKLDSNIILPSFEENSMYKGMKLYKRYTLEELGI